MSLLKHAEQCLHNQLAFKVLNAFISPVKDAGAVLENAEAAENRARLDQSRSEIDGRLIAIKDNICTSDYSTTCASEMLRGFASPYPATVVEKLHHAGAIVAGKTNMDEFGMGSHSTHSTYGPVHGVAGNDAEQISVGGSSGGSALAVATGQCYAALGTDTGGSVRLPAAYTGTIGFKPSFGIISRWGTIAYANSLDTVGIFGMNNAVVRQVFAAIRGYDSRDPTCLSPPSLSRIADRLRQRKPRKSMRIGVPSEYNTQELEPKVREVWYRTLRIFQELGHSIYQVSLPATKRALSAYYVIAPAEASSNLAKYDKVRYGEQVSNRSESEGTMFAGIRGKGLGEEVRRRILLGAYSLSAGAMDNYFIQAQKVRRMVQQDFNDVFALSHPLQGQDKKTTSEGVDVLISPTAPTLPPRLSSIAGRAPVSMYSDDALTVPASLAGLPALSFPVPITDCRAGVGMQVIAQYGDDESVLEVAQILEDEHARERTITDV